MKFFQLCKKVIKFIFKSFAMFITGAFVTIVIFMLGLWITSEISNYNKYGKALQIDVPKRHAELHEDTHGGFQGDGDTWEMYQLTDKEVAKLDEAVNTNDNWKPINDEVYSLFPFNTVYNDQFTKTYDGWYCLYNKQTKSHIIPSELKREPSYNFIIGLYIKNERQLWIYEEDT